MSADAGTQAARDIAGDLLHGAWPRVEVARLFAPINERAVLALLSRTGKDGLKLSDRVWRIGEKYRNAVTRLVEDGVARGLDSRKLAREVQQYLTPGKFTGMKQETRRRLGVSKDVSYEAMRLARTEMNNAYHEGCIMANRANPGYRGIYWRLSASHPIHDTCDDMAATMKFGEPGFYPEGKEPDRPHPSCTCVVCPSYEDPDQFTDRLNEWMRNPKSQPDIEKWYKGYGDSGGAGALSLQRPQRGSTAMIREDPISILKSLETEIGGRASEKAYLLDSSGGVILAKEGDEHSVTFTAEELEFFPGSILTHNHPSGQSFSPSDIKMATEHRLSEIRAVGTGFTYSASAEQVSWPEWSKTAAAANDVKDEVLRDLLVRINSEELTPEEGSMLYWHCVWSRVSDLAGFLYRRDPR